MTEPPQYPSAPDPNLPPSAATPPPTPPYGGYGTPPPTPPYGGYGTPPGTPPPPPPAPPAYGMPGGPQGGPPAFDVMAAFSYGWNAFKANAGAFLVLGILAVIVPALISALAQASSSGGAALERETSDRVFDLGGNLLGLGLNIVSQVIALFFTAASIRAAFDVTEGRRVDLGAAFTRWSKLQVVLLSILVAIGTMVGILLCVLPGIVFIFFTWYSTFFVVGNAQSSITAIGSSFRFTADNIGNLVLLFLMSILVALLGLLACVVGLLVAMPIITVAAAYAFRVLQGQPVAAV